MREQTRPETGPMQFGKDWTGIFIRGDRALYFGLILNDFLTRKTELSYLENKMLEQLRDLLNSAMQGSSSPDLLKDYVDCKPAPISEE